MRELGFPERLVEIERDSWILITAQVPDEAAAWMALKRDQVENGSLRGLYLETGELVDLRPR